LQRETGSFQQPGKSSQVIHAKFDLSLDGHRKSEYTAGGGLRGGGATMKV
jgi:hypothetical protein